MLEDKCSALRSCDPFDSSDYATSRSESIQKTFLIEPQKRRDRGGDRWHIMRGFLRSIWRLFCDPKKQMTGGPVADFLFAIFGDPGFVRIKLWTV